MLIFLLEASLSSSIVHLINHCAILSGLKIVLQGWPHSFLKAITRLDVINPMGLTCMLLICRSALQFVVVRLSFGISLVTDIHCRLLITLYTPLKTPAVCHNYQRIVTYTVFISHALVLTIIAMCVPRWLFPLPHKNSTRSTFCYPNYLRIWLICGYVATHPRWIYESLHQAVMALAPHSIWFQVHW